MSHINNYLDELLQVLETRWNDYRAQGGFEQFVEYTLTLNSLTEQLSRHKLPGLVRQSESLENAALGLFGAPSTHPIPEDRAVELDERLNSLLNAAGHNTNTAQQNADQRRAGDGPEDNTNQGDEWHRSRDIALCAPPGHPWAEGISEQLAFFGFKVINMEWGDPFHEGAPLAALFISPEEFYRRTEIAYVEEARTRFPATQLICLSVPGNLDDVVHLLRAGADITIPVEEKTSSVLARILDLIQLTEQERYRVLVVEDSMTAVAQIQRSLGQHGIDSHPVRNPQEMLIEIEQYRPDLVLMDMYMPHCTGVEATRVLRQLPAYQSIPVVYLSSETDMALQIEALRLGGDQFLTKPFNPVFLAAIVKTKIERYRDAQRASHHDSLTGLLNHSAAKMRLDRMLRGTSLKGHLAVAMIDIDRFKSINDTYGHPVGDQVIRSLAWLLKGRLRSCDLIGRYGGEEFIIALQDAGLKDAVAVIDRIRRDFATLPLAHGSGIFSATFSAGVSAYPNHTTSEALTQAADEALLNAKRLGRNRVEAQ